MARLVDFLAQLGRNSRLHRASPEELETAMERAGLTPAERIALSNVDRHEMERQAGAVANTCCIIHHADQGDEDTGEALPAPQMRDAA